MSKNLEISLLYDFYGDMLTDKQKEVIEFYYNEDLSLAEISQHEGITRQGVRDNIKRAEGILLEFEERLGLARRFRELQEGLEQINLLAKEIDLLNGHFYSREIDVRAKEICRIARKLGD